MSSGISAPNSSSANGAPTFTIGEEVLYQGDRYVISTASPQPPYRFQLLATTPSGVRFAWVNPEQLGKMTSYTEPVDDTKRI